MDDSESDEEILLDQEFGGLFESMGMKAEPIEAETTPAAAGGEKKEAEKKKEE